jgi:hypothetical protein
MDATVLKFKPDRFRLFSNSFLQFSAGALIGLPIFVLIATLLGVSIHFESVIINHLGVIVGGTIGVAIGASKGQETGTIVISNEYVAGPSLFWGKRIHFPLLTLNIEKSSKKNIFLRLLGCRYLVSTAGAKILFAERNFDKNQVAQIYQALGFAKANGTQHS